ncbi:lipase [Lysinibacter sp. HNR]|uniref:lipase n=1 Tax=Lysinibacter sp. HNR TaxID=3031408 RepID=UPI0024351534|nr:lipase [Lysinibacter sp. HNR]WGD37097.1 lipase [Lysinibacter sp. HNR]
MKASRKNVILVVISALTVSLTASPAQAAEPTFASFEPSAALISTQTFDTEIEETGHNFAEQSFGVAVKVESSAAGAPEIVNNNAGHNFDVNKAIATAYSEVGTRRATGWSAPGECIMSAQRWLLAGGAAWTGSGTPVNNYKGAARVDLNALAPGDVIQYQYNPNPHLYANGVHTVLVVGNNPDGTLQIIESNNPAGSGLVQYQKSWTPSPPKNFTAVGYRF